jgi:hypothetical protein
MPKMGVAEKANFHGDPPFIVNVLTMDHLY